jgi:hypothetical protein
VIAPLLTDAQVAALYAAADEFDLRYVVDRIVRERMAQAWDEGYLRGSLDAPSIWSTDNPYAWSAEQVRERVARHRGGA